MKLRQRHPRVFNALFASTSMNNISIFTPTKNRPEFVARLLKYYQAIDFQGPVLIGDSSDSAHLDRTKSLINEFGQDLDLNYYEMPGLNGVQCVGKLIQLVPTPYATFVADDDYMVPSALYQCVDFMEDNPDYSAAHGLGFLFSVQGDAPHGPIIDAGFFRQPVLEGESASSRLASLFGNYAVSLFSVTKTSTWQDLYKQSDSITDWRRFGGELLQCGRTAIAGKIKQLECLQLVRQVHQPSPVTTFEPNGKASYSAINMSSTSTEDVFSWLTNPHWSKSYETFNRLLSDEMANYDNISVTLANNQVKQVFWKYLANIITEKWDDKFTPEDTSLKHRIKRAARSLPGSDWLYQQMKSTRSKQKVSIQSMIKPNSPFHQDFMPIYKSITGKMETST